MFLMIYGNTVVSHIRTEQTIVPIRDSRVFFFVFASWRSLSFHWTHLLRLDTCLTCDIHWNVYGFQFTYYFFFSTHRLYCTFPKNYGSTYDRS
jgi:hypothetical protein